MNCNKCDVKFQYYWIKDGLCNGCRNPHLIVKAEVCNAQESGKPCDLESCQECCEHHEVDHFICIDCGSDLNGSPLCDRGFTSYE